MNRLGRNVAAARAAFTLAELLVALAIIGLLAALFLPAVQQARESARRAQCISNLRQQGLALHAYEGAHRVFPAGFRHGFPARTCFAELLPHLEQGHLNYRLQDDWTAESNRAAATTPLPALLCPSAPNAPRFALSPAGFAAGDYAPTHGVNAGYCRLVGWPEYAPPDLNGVMTDQPCRLCDILDGLSQTIVLVEDAGRPELWRMGRRAEGAASNAAWADPHYEIALDGSDRSLTGIGEKLGDCVMNCTNSNEAYSFHPGGVHVLFADGAVRFTSQTIEPRIYAAISTKASGEANILDWR